MVSFLSVGDLAPFASIDDEKAQAMVEDAEAMAMLAAPCLATEPTELTLGQQSAVRAILRGAILRWHEAGTGAYQSQQVTRGPFGESVTMDTRQARRGMFWPSEIEDLRDICGGTESGVFDVDTAYTSTVVHAETCALYFGADYCSCGAVLTGLLPLYGG